ncbi:MAG TPA: branched-chain amino acid ABC transporter permease [Candidatus Dormibacteraeota bacterium]
MNELGAVLISGLVSGATYALLGLGIVIIFRTTDVVNFAIGDFGMISVYVAFALLTHAGWPVVAGVIAAVLVSGALGVVTERTVIRPLGPGRTFAALVLTLALSLILVSVAGMLFGHTPQAFPVLVPGTVTLAGLVVAWQKIATAGLALVAMGVIAFFMRYTTLGIAMRAAAEDPYAAKVVGINRSLIAPLAWFIGCGLAGLAAVLLAPDATLTVTLMVAPLFRAFAGVFLGGLQSMVGAAIGGFAIGVLDDLAGRYVSASFRDTIVFGIIVLVLFLRPAGLLATQRRERV